jgi:hypothetical protein
VPTSGPDPYSPSAASLAEAGLLVSREEVEAFAGKNGPVYWSMLAPYRQCTTLFAGFNMASCAFGMAWLCHRKLYWEAVAAAVMVIP